MIFETIQELEHEQLLFHHDKESGLKAIVAIHNTTLGPAMGGTRMWDYKNDEDAIRDVLRLSRGMTFKSSAAGLDLGGGKAVIIGDAKTQKSKKLMQAFGRFIESINGQYITAEDVNMSEEDMAHIASQTNHVVGKSSEFGGMGDPSPWTAYTTYLGMKAACKVAYGTDELSDLTILVQGVGSVGTELIRLLVEEGAVVSATDIFPDKLNTVAQEFGIETIDANAVFNNTYDVYSPNALGATLNTDSISSAKFKVVAGAANNQLEDEKVHGELLRNSGIHYAPDFLINSGGIINVGAEYYSQDEHWVKNLCDKVYENTLKVFESSEQNAISTHAAAMILAKKRLDQKVTMNEHH